MTLDRTDNTGSRAGGLHGAVHLRGLETRYRVWAPYASAVTLQLLRPTVKSLGMTPDRRGYFELVVNQTGPGARYFYQLDGGPSRPDPASRFQPEGVHGPSEVVDCSFAWQDQAWHGLPLERCVFYELHVGTFAGEGTFDAVIPHLTYLRDLGVTVIELMPVAQFPGTRNWGYDGVYPFAAQNSYGGPSGLKRLVDACHRHGLGVALDVVYNHLGPEGNYLAEFGPYFTDRYKTPWGPAVNFDGPESDEVRRFFIESALYWVCDFHVDALRLDAVHAIFDRTAYPFLEELGRAVHREATQLNRRVHVIAESDLNDPRLVRSKELGGMGLDAQWNDGFHHALRTLLTGDRSGYYQDYGELRHLAKAYREGFVISGQHSAFRRRRHGASSRDIPAGRFVVFSQNHDQVGNRLLGERLGGIVSFEARKLAAGVVILSPFLPLLFMGEEYGETAPFLYFVDHSDPDLMEAVRRGRKEEFASFDWQSEPPDPQAEESFLKSKLRLDRRAEGQHQTLLRFYRELLRLRRETPALSALDKDDMEVSFCEGSKLLSIHRWWGEDEALLLLCFGETGMSVRLPVPAGRWRKLLDSSEHAWDGPGSELPSHLEAGHGVDLRLPPQSVVVYERSGDD